MKTEREMKTYCLEELTNKDIGKKGTPKRDKFENELRLELAGETFTQAPNLSSLEKNYSSFQTPIRIRKRQN